MILVWSNGIFKFSGDITSTSKIPKGRLFVVNKFGKPGEGSSLPTNSPTSSGSVTPTNNSNLRLDSSIDEWNE